MLKVTIKEKNVFKKVRTLYLIKNEKDNIF